MPHTVVVTGNIGPLMPLHSTIIPLKSSTRVGSMCPLS